MAAKSIERAISIFGRETIRSRSLMGEKFDPRTQITITAITPHP
jgi:hypothetical protein